MKRRVVGGAIFISILILAFSFSFVPVEINLENRLSSPTFAAPFGYDTLGRNLALEVSRGTLVSISISFSVVVISMVMGIFFAYFMSKEGFASSVFSVITDSFKVIPSVILALFFASISGPGGVKLVIALSIGSSANIARTLYLKIRELMKEPYIKCSESFGIKKSILFISHVLPQLFPYIREQGLSLAISSILTESSLSYLGCGVKVTTPSLGGILAEARPIFLSSPWMAFFPTVIMLLLAISLTLISRSYGRGSL